MSVAGLSRKVTLEMNLVIRLQLTFIACLVSFFALSHAGAAERPNVVWIVVDDMSPNFSCYGETVFRRRMLIAWLLRACGSRERMLLRLYARHFGLP